MAAASTRANSLGRLLDLLRNTGYLQRLPSEGSGNGSRYSFGPAGTLLRHNIMQSWWTKMVTCAENTFPVSGCVQDPLMYYPAVGELANQRVPFSLMQQTTHENDRQSHQDSFLMDSSNVTSMLIASFCAPGSSGLMFDEIVNTRMRWWKQCASNPSHFHLSDASNNNVTGSHIVYRFPWGEEILETILNKGDNSLKQMAMAKEAKQMKETYKFEIDNQLAHPHQIDSTTTLEAAMTVFLHNAYTEKPRLQGQGDRQILQLHPHLAPFKVAVTTKGKQGRELEEIARYISRECRKAGIQLLNVIDKCSLDTKIERSDRMGTPFMLIVSDSTLKTGAIGMRNRDSTIKEELAIDKIPDYLTRRTT